jgi:hypothetical protein
MLIFGTASYKAGNIRMYSLVMNRVSPRYVQVMSMWPLLVTCSTQSLTDKVGLVLILHQPSIPTIRELHQPPAQLSFCATAYS